jgi:hypothetical protein
MAATHSSTALATPATGTAPTISITVSGTNPALIVFVGLDSFTAASNSCSWSLGGGTPVLIASIRSANGAYAAVWKVPAPTAGAGTITLGNSASVPYVAAVQLWTGADQTDPSPNANAVTSTAATTPLTLTPTSLVSGDASAGMGANIIAGNWSAATTNQRAIDNSADPGYLVGDSANTTGVTFTNDGGMLAVDIALLAVVQHSRLDKHACDDRLQDRPRG